ncbi:amidohydrolase family protein [Amycolatopsis pithecellobii]|uniref:Amidohydrolase family protein n=1 Tax=Amycolatopsis pithecellobii TaxID=664692 RepID=A0A6N7Z862_9PSEU|nr:amidohydrolase family protein [Amycolatopsis pithecellobii]MTD56486.1 amidohydrolase family protein [Amycolatopsis pithecellobii]
MNSNPVIDFHSHILVADVVEETAAHNVYTGFGARTVQPPAGSRFDEVFKRMLDPALHLPDMDKAGVDAEVLLSTTVIQGSSWAPPERDLALNACVNDEIAGWVDRDPERFVGSCTVPLQDLALAIPELERCVRGLGARVVQVPSHVGGRYLGHASLRPFWEAVRDLGIVALLHPEGIADPWFQDYALWNSVGQPIEEAKALSSMIYDGLLEAMPELVIVIAHGGGFLPHYFGRLDRNVHNMPHSARNLSKNPGEYLAQLYFDTCVYDPAVLAALVSRFGADHLVMGADYPVGENDPVGFVRHANLPTEQENLVLGRTAARLLGR